MFKRATMRLVSLGTALAGERIVSVNTREEAEAVLHDAGWADVTTERAAGYPALLSLAHV